MSQNYEMDLTFLAFGTELVGKCKVIYEAVDNKGSDLEDNVKIENIEIGAAGKAYNINKDIFSDFVSDKIDEMLKDCGTFYTGIGEINIDVDEIKLITDGLNNGEKIENLLKEIDNPIEMKENDFGIDR